LWHIPLEGPNPKPRSLGAAAIGQTCDWKDDATLIVRHREIADAKANPPAWPWKTHRMDVATAAVTPLAFPADRLLMNLTADGGKALVVRPHRPNPKSDDLQYDTGFVDVATGKITPWLDGPTYPVRVSGDGKLVAGLQWGADRKHSDHVVIDVTTKAVVSRFRIVDGDRRWLTGQVAFDGPRAVGAMIETMRSADSDRGWGYGVGTFDRASKTRKVYFTTDANETIVTFDVR
jgi:hypothetical protein